MRIWLTEIRTFEGILWCGDDIKAISKKHAEEILNTSSRGYMEVIGWLVCSIDEDTGKRIDNDVSFLN